MKALSILVAAVALLAGPAVAPAQTAAPAVRVEHAWARASAGPAKTGAAYLTLENTGTAPDRLTDVSSPVAASAAVHVTVNDGGVLRMRAVSAVQVNPGERVVFEPSGLHVMLVDLDAPLREGASFPLVLTFEKSGTVEVTVPVRGVGAMEMSHGGHAEDPKP